MQQLESTFETVDRDRLDALFRLKQTESDLVQTSSDLAEALERVAEMVGGVQFEGLGLLYQIILMLYKRAQMNKYTFYLSG